MDQRKYRQFRGPDALLDYIESLITDRESYYILLDHFEEALNSLLHIKNADVYVTVSNSKLLSKDIITEFRGREDEIHVFPLTLKNLCRRLSAVGSLTNPSRYRSDF